MIPYLKEIISNASLVSKKDSYKDKHTAGEACHYISDKVFIGKNNYDVQVSIMEDVNGNKFYNLEENKEEGSNSTIPNTAPTLSKGTIQQNSENVNDDGINLIVRKVEDANLLGSIRFANAANPEDITPHPNQP